MDEQSQFFNDYVSQLMQQSYNVQQDDTTPADEEQEESDYITNLRAYDAEQEKETKFDEGALFNKLSQFIEAKLGSLDEEQEVNSFFADSDGQDYLTNMYDTQNDSVPFTPQHSFGPVINNMRATRAAGSRSRNNYGNIRDLKTGQFRSFDTPEQGRQALVDQLNIYRSGKSRTGVKANSTLQEAMSIYAPKGDGANNPVAYANFISKRLGVPTSTPINQIDPNQWADAIATMEGNRNIDK